LADRHIIISHRHYLIANYLVQLWTKSLRGQI
jgi:hypothetical protein